MSRHTLALVEVALALRRLLCSRHRPELFPQLRQTSIRVRKLTGHLLQMSQEVRVLFSHLSAERLDLGEHRQQLTIGGIEHLLIDGLEHDERTATA